MTDHELQHLHQRLDQLADQLWDESARRENRDRALAEQLANALDALRGLCSESEWDTYLRLRDDGMDPTTAMRCAKALEG